MVIIKCVEEGSWGTRRGINHCKDIRSKINKLLPAPPVFGDGGALCTSSSMYHFGPKSLLLGLDLAVKLQWSQLLSISSIVEETARVCIPSLV